MSGERWKPIPGFRGKYEASSRGRIRSLLFINGMVRNRREVPLVMKQTTAHTGYKLVSLCKGGRVTTFSVHRLVLSSFRGQRSRKYVCAHLDGNRVNNNLANLVWATYIENENHKKLHGRNLAGSRNHQAKLSETAVTEFMRLYNSGFGASRLARHFDISKATADRIAAGKSWKHVTGSLPRRGKLKRHPYAVLSDRQVRELRSAWAAGRSMSGLAKEQKLSFGVVYAVVHGTTYKDVKP